MCNVINNSILMDVSMDCNDAQGLGYSPKKNAMTARRVVMSPHCVLDREGSWLIQKPRRLTVHKCQPLVLLLLTSRNTSRRELEPTWPASARAPASKYALEPSLSRTRFVIFRALETCGTALQDLLHIILTSSQTNINSIFVFKNHCYP